MRVAAFDPFSVGTADGTTAVRDIAAATMKRGTVTAVKEARILSGFRGREQASSEVGSTEPMSICSHVTADIVHLRTPWLRRQDALSSMQTSAVLPNASSDPTVAQAAQIQTASMARKPTDTYAVRMCSPSLALIRTWRSHPSRSSQIELPCYALLSTLLHFWSCHHSVGVCRGLLAIFIADMDKPVYSTTLQKVTADLWPRERR